MLALGWADRAVRAQIVQGGIVEAAPVTRHQAPHTVQDTPQVATAQDTVPGPALHPVSLVTPVTLVMPRHVILQATTATVEGEEAEPETHRNMM